MADSPVVGYADALFSVAEAEGNISAVEDELFGSTESTPGSHPDVVDYDGMGNQGRFPASRKK